MSLYNPEVVSLIDYLYVQHTMVCHFLFLKQLQNASIYSHYKIEQYHQLEHLKHYIHLW